MLYILLGLLAFVGGFIILSFYYLLYGGIYSALLVFFRMFSGAKAEVREETMLSPSSLPAMIAESGSVFDYVAKLKNEDKKEAYSTILTDIRAIVLEVSKHPDTYPAAGKFCGSQLNSLIRKSSVAKCMETAKFRVEAETFIVDELIRLDLGNIGTNRRWSYDTSRYTI